MGDITNNFSFYEYRPNGENRKWLPPFDYMKLMIVEHANMMQIIRDAHGSAISFNSAVRLPSDYQRLIDAGYNPSPTSDHFFGLPVTIPEKEKVKISKFGSIYTMSSGAVDARSRNTKKLYKDIIDLNKSGKINPGQVIYESDIDMGWEWIHIGLNPTFLFSDKLCDLRSKHRYLYTHDGGKTYRIGIDYGIIQ